MWTPLPAAFKVRVAAPNEGLAGEGQSTVDIATIGFDFTKNVLQAKSSGRG